VIEFQNLLELEALARERLDPKAFDYYAGGAGDELTVRANRAAWDRIAIRYRVLVDVSRRDLSTTVLGARVAMPILVAPTAFHRLAHEEGELATTRAAGAAGTVMILSTLSTTSVEDVVRVATGPVWFQLYVAKDRACTVDLVRRVEQAGVTALVLTVDAPLLGRRERDVRNRFALPDHFTVPHLPACGLTPDAHGSALAAAFGSQLDPSLGWDALAWLRSITKLPVLVKGIVRGDDAALAVDHGAAGVVVSNHGGRQLDGSVATADVLAEVVQATAGRAEVLVDGGVRRGTDVLKALALGARAVLLGRPVLYGLAAGGEGGVSRVLSLLASELEVALALSGAPTIASVGRDLVRV
jgi:4-hydroxymandelate oxidase